MSKTGLIYTIVNTENGKRYVGFTTNFPTRIRSHLNTASTLGVDSQLYRDMNADVGKFAFQIIQSDVPLKDLRSVETEWIKKLGTCEEYNQVRKSGRERLTESELHELRVLIETTSLKFEEIGEMFGVSPAIIADINLGRAWSEDRYSYPLRKSTIKRKKLSEEDVLDIYSQLRNPRLSFQQIADSYGWSSQAVLRKINNGTYSISPLSSDAYPIRSVDSRKGRRL